MKQENNKNLLFIIKSSIFFGILSLLFSILGIFQNEAVQFVNPLQFISFEHVFGHIIFGMIVGAASRRLHYFILGGLFAIILDADHIIQLFLPAGIERMGHSISFGIIASVILWKFNKKDFLLGSVALGAIISHISFDSIITAEGFPLFAPFYSKEIHFDGITDWILLEMIAIVVVFVGSILAKNNKSDKKFKGVL